MDVSSSHSIKNLLLVYAKNSITNQRAVSLEQFKVFHTFLTVYVCVCVCLCGCVCVCVSVCVCRNNFVSLSNFKPISRKSSLIGSLFYNTRGY